MFDEPYRFDRVYGNMLLMVCRRCWSEICGCRQPTIARRSTCSVTHWSQPASIIVISIPTRYPARNDWPGLVACLDYLNAGDTLVVWKLDWLEHSLSHLLTIVTELKARGIPFRSSAAVRHQPRQHLLSGAESRGRCKHDPALLGFM